jgi:hypothetical protein
MSEHAIDTPEQQMRIRQLKSVGENRAVVNSAPAQNAEWEAAVEQDLGQAEKRISTVHGRLRLLRNKGVSG